VHPAALREAALSLVAEGHNDCDVARRLGIPRTTVRDWRRPRYVPRQHKLGPTCPRCGRAARPSVLGSADYAELLGLYLGDGHIARLARTERLRLFLDARYPTIVAETAALLARGFPANRVRRVHFHDGAEVVLDVYSRHLSCLFPQHGAGKKHHRPIVLEPWQEDHVGAAPWAFLRGCIRSDGCVYVNRTGPYEYLSYDFANWSADILDIFERTCRALGLRPRRYEKSIRLYRRADVARLVEHVGTKS
jgi:Homeodomain-like domain